jgi:O-antigen/teichoic acid export membrane protein
VLHQLLTNVSLQQTIREIWFSSSWYFMLKRFSGPTALLLANIFSGASGYLATVLVYRTVSSEQYLLFATYWAGLFFFLGAMSGLQQEMTRATSPRLVQQKVRISASWSLSTGLSLAVFLALTTSAPIWSRGVFGALANELIWPFAFGAAMYLLLAPLGGALYGLSRWGSVSILIALDGLFRIVMLAVALAFTSDVVTLAWCVSAPFPIAVAVLWPFIWKKIRNKSQVDVSISKLSSNVFKTLLATASTSLLVSGLPAVIAVGFQSSQPKYIAELVFAITLLRSPLVVAAISMQSYLIVKFRDEKSRTRALLFWIFSGVFIITAPLACAAFFWGNNLLQLISGRNSNLLGADLAGVVISSGLLAVMVAFGSSLLATRSHISYSLGWILSAIVTVTLILMEGSTSYQVILALILGPVAGLGTFLVSYLVSPKTFSQRKIDN